MKMEKAVLSLPVLSGSMCAGNSTSASEPEPDKKLHGAILWDLSLLPALRSLLQAVWMPSMVP